MIQVCAPASKSLSHRYLIGAALAKGRSIVRQTLESADLVCTRRILAAAGASLTPVPEAGGLDSKADGSAWQVDGCGRPKGGQTVAVDCNVGESGTTCRLLTAVLAAGEGSFRIHGEGRMHERPLGELVRALLELGAGIGCLEKPDHPPLEIRARGLTPPDRPVRLGMDVSSQYFSGLLLAAPLAKTPMTIDLAGKKAVSWPYVGLTLQCLGDFGIGFTVFARPDPDSPWQALDRDGWRDIAEAVPGCLRVTVQPGEYRAGEYTVEGDWSGASYLLAAGALGQDPVLVSGLDPRSLQGDRAIMDILARMGAGVECGASGITISPARLKAASLDMGACPDLVPTVAMLAACAEGQSVIHNVAHLRYKESDRILAVLSELRKLGIEAEERPDGMAIKGGQPLFRPDLALSCHNDHRIAMSLALMALRQPGLDIRGHLDAPQVVAKSFPQFWQVWDKIRSIA